MRQAITTKFIAPTNYRGSRVKAKASAGSIVVGWNHALNVEDNHRRAAMALAAKLGWEGHWYSGGLPSEDGNVYVCATTSDFVVISQAAAELCSKIPDNFTVAHTV